MTWWIWVLAGLLLLALEFATGVIGIGFFAIGAFVVAVLVGFGPDLPLWGQLLIFTGVSVVSLLLIRPWMVRKLKLNEPKQEIDTLVGEQAFAIEEIGVKAIGKAELRGTTWSARNVGETSLTRGQRCVVAGVEGLIIHIRAT